MRKVCLSLSASNSDHLDGLCGFLNLDQSKLLRLALEHLYDDLYDQLVQWRSLVMEAEALETKIHQVVDYDYLRRLISVPRLVHSASCLKL